MLTIRSWALAAAAAVLLAACGGNDPEVPGSADPAGAPTTAGSFSAVVSFGDSLSDVGTYSPATSLSGNGAPPYFGGKFTTNDGATSAIWVETLAARLGLLVTPAEFGFAGSSVRCPAAANPALAGTCTAYGQGGSRISDPNGIGKAGGALTVPVRTQVANHLQRFSSFGSGDLVFVLAGNNDAFIQFAVFAATAAQVQADAQAGLIGADEANRRLFRAQTAAQDEMKKAAQELTETIRSEILAKGARYVAVLMPVNAALTPFGDAVPPNARPVLTALTDTFDLWLRDGLAGQPVKLISLDPLLSSARADPAALGLVNATVPACDAARIELVTSGAVKDGSSLFCNATPGAPYNGLRAGADGATWLFADSVHPTTAGHRLIADYVQAQLHAFGWL